MHDQKFGQPSTNMHNARYIATVIIKVHNSCTIYSSTEQRQYKIALHVRSSCMVVTTCYGYAMICN